MQTYFQTQAIGANKRARTRNALIDSAIDVFSEKGVEQARISDIAAIAGLANGTFYNHFKDKDELAVASAAAIALEIAKGLDVAMQGITRGATRVVVASSAFIRIAIDNRAWGAVLVEQYHRRSVRGTPALDYLRADVERALAQQKLDTTVDDFLLQQISALMMAELREQLLAPEPERLRRVCENILRVLGFTPDPGPPRGGARRPPPAGLTAAILNTIW